MRKKLLIGASLGLLIILILTQIAHAVTWTFSFPVTVTDTSNVTRTYYPVTLNATGQQYINAGYINTNGLNTNMQIGNASIPYMLSTTKVITVVPSLSGGGRAVTTFYTGYSPPQTSFPIVLGDGGYVTTNYTAAINLGKNYSVPMGVYLYGTGLVVNDSHGLNVSYNSTSSNVTTFIKKDVTTSTSDGDVTKNSAVYNTAWTAVAGDSVSAALGQWAVGQRFNGATYDIYRAFMYFNTTNVTGNITSASLLLFLNSDSSTTDFNLVIQKGSAGHPADPLVVGDYDKTFYSGNYGSFNTAGLAAGYNVIPITDTSFINAGSTTNISLRSDNDINGVAPAGDEFVNFDSAESGVTTLPMLYITFTLNTVSGVTQGYHIITPYADSTNAWTTVDSSSSTNVTAIDTSDINAASGSRSFGSNATSYFNYIKIVVGGVEKVWYQPNTMVIGTSLPDRDGTKNGDITYGTNQNISLHAGTMVSNNSTVSTGSNATVGFTMPTVSLPNNWFGGGSTTTLPFYDEFSAVSSSSGVSTQMIYFIIAIAFALLAMLLVMRFTRSNLLGIIVFNSILFMGTSNNVVPMWVAFSTTLVQFGILYLSRQV